MDAKLRPKKNSMNSFPSFTNIDTLSLFSSNERCIRGAQTEILKFTAVPIGYSLKANTGNRQLFVDVLAKT